MPLMPVLALLAALVAGCQTGPARVTAKVSVPSATTTVTVPGPAPASVDIPHTATPLVVDGVLDEAVWQTAQVSEINFQFDKLGQSDPAPIMRARFAWDEQYLYIGYELWDSHLVALSDGREKGPAGNRRQAVLPWGPEKQIDCAEFFVSFGDRRFLWELQHNAANHFNEVFLVVLDPAWAIAESQLNFLGLLMQEEQYLKDDRGATLKTAVRLWPKADGQPSTINAAGDTDTGYTGELRLPWAGLGAPKAARDSAKKAGRPGWDMAGRELLVLAVRLNGNDGWLYHHNSPTRVPKGMLAAAAEQFPRGRLLAPTATPSPAGN